MATKRDLKKFIRNTCGGMALEMITMGRFFDQIDNKDIEQIVYDCAMLQMQTLSRINIAYDHKQADFADAGAYKRARSEYYHKAYKALMSEFTKGVEAIVAHMNQATPDDVKSVLKKAANA